MHCGELPVTSNGLRQKSNFTWDRLFSCGTDFPVGHAEDATAYRPAGKPVPQAFPTGFQPELRFVAR
jgi:hypothetical protein